MKKILFALLFVVLPLCAFADKEDVQYFYEEITLNKKCLSKNTSGKIEKAETILVETHNLEEGTYEVQLKKVGDHIYHIVGTKLYIEMKYCYEYFLYDDVILKVKKYGSRIYGEIIY